MSAQRLTNCSNEAILSLKARKDIGTLMLALGYSGILAQPLSWPSESPFCIEKPVFGMNNELLVCLEEFVHILQLLVDNSVAY